MTFQEATIDKNRPLSMTPREWMQYSEANEHEEKEVFDNTANRMCAEKRQSKDGASVNATENGVIVDATERLEVGIEQMVFGCRVAMRALNEIERQNVSIKERKNYDGISNIVNNAIAPYLADVMKFRKGLYE